MTNVGALIFAQLNTDPAVTTLLLGADGQCRIFPNRLPQVVEYPAAAYHAVTDVPQVSFGGYTSGLRRVRLQIDAYSRVYAEAREAADAIAEVLKAHAGDDFTSSLILRRDLSEVEEGDVLHRISQDFSIWVSD